MRYACLALVLICGAPPAKAFRLDPRLPYLRQRIRAKKLPPGFTRDQIAWGSRELPASIRFRVAPTANELKRLEAIGVSFERHERGTMLHVGTIYAVRVAFNALERVLDDPNVARLESSIRPGRLPLLDVTGGDIQAPSVWGHDKTGRDGTTGKGIIIANMDSGIDPFHPAFYRGNGGLYAWLDVDGDGRLTFYQDAVDLNGDGEAQPEERLGFFDSQVSNLYTGTIINDNGRFEPDLDILFADANNNGTRDYGSTSGFTEADPGHGEPMFVVDDVNQNGRLDVDEKLIMLDESKIAAIRNDDGTVRRRGIDLIYHRPDSYAYHGTGVTGILVGGIRGHQRYVGIAPDADILLISSSTDVGGIAFAQAEGAHVINYEFATFIGEFQDGSSNFELAVTQAAADGMVQSSATGNLGSAGKHTRFLLGPGIGRRSSVNVTPFNYGDTILPLQAIYVQYVWLGTRSEIDITLEDPAGNIVTIPQGAGGSTSVGNHNVDVLSDTSSRGTTYVLLMVWRDTGGGYGDLTEGLYTAELTNGGTQSLDVHGYVFDDISGWSRGADFRQDLTDDGTILWPGTADDAITTGAYGGRNDLTFEGYGPVGEVRGFSGWGKRIDGTSILDIVAPDDPYTAAMRDDTWGVPFGSYESFGGTSGAIPHVAAAAALLLEAQPTLGHFGVKQRLIDGADPTGFADPLPSDKSGWGRLRIYAALTGQDPVANEAPAVFIDAPSTLIAGNDATLRAVITDPDTGDAEAVQVRWDIDYDGNFESDFSTTLDHVETFDRPGRFTVKVQAVDPQGATAEAIVTLVVTSAPYRPRGADEGGCNCHGAPGSVLALGGVALLAAARRRRASDR